MAIVAGQVQLLATSHPAAAVSEPAQVLGDLFAENWPLFALFALAAIGIAVAVSLFRTALTFGARMVTGGSYSAGQSCTRCTATSVCDFHEDMNREEWYSMERYPDDKYYRNIGLD
jgi:hypothetical protein